MKLTLLPMALLATISFTPLHADVVTEDLSGTDVSGGEFYWGQSFTTSSGGPWNNITFNFYDAVGTPIAAGTGYILSAAYFGTPDDLPSAGTLLATSVSTSGGYYIYSPGFTLLSNVQYFHYSDGLMQLQGNGTSYAGGSYAFSFGTNVAFQNPNDNDLNFTVNGTTVPEPATWGLLIAGFAMTGVALRRRVAAAA